MKQHLCIAVGLMIMAACNDITVPEDSPGTTGLIVERDRPTSFSMNRPTIWVKETEESECGVIFVITDATEIFRRDRLGRASSIDDGALPVGSRVRVWSDFVLRSCPGQATAEVVELVTGD